MRGAVDRPLVIEYADYACPHCARAELLLSELPVRRVFRHFPVPSKHPRALALAQAAEAAANQGRFWEMHDALFGDHGRIDDPHLWERARRLGLDLERFERDRRSEAVAERVARDFRSGIGAGVVTTPTLFVGAERHPGVPDTLLLERLRAAPGPLATLAPDRYPKSATGRPPTGGGAKGRHDN